MKEKILISLIFFLSLFPLAFSASPSIEKTWSDPFFVAIGNNVSLYAEVFDADDDLDKVLVNVTSPSNQTEVLEMENISSNIFRANYTVNESGAYVYLVFANDTAGNFNLSEENYFFGGILLTEEVIIRVEVLGVCSGIIADFGFPSLVYQNETVIFVIVFENNGNIPLTNRTFFMDIYNQTGHNIAHWESPGYVKGILDVWDIDFYWNEWDTKNVPIGNYTAVAAVDYRTLLGSGNETFSDFSELNETAECEPINQTDNTTTCRTLRNISCTYLPVGSPIQVNTPNVSSLTVSRMKNGTTGYEGSFQIDTNPYFSINFWMENCEEYCYSCITPDRIINQSEECNYEKYVIPSVKYYVYDVDSSGKSVVYKQTNLTCSYMETIWDCVIFANNSAFCNKTISCYGRAQVEKEFQVVNATGPQPPPPPPPQPTPTPTPTPSPTPAPSPGAGPQPGQTQIAVEIEPLERYLKVYQGDWLPSVFNVTNLGNVNVTDIELIPILPEGWEGKSALVSFLDVGQTVNRTIFVRPPYTALGEYVIPVKAVRGNVTLDIDYFWVTVLEAINRTRLELLEVPRAILMYTSSNLTLPVLLKNVGKVPLTNISLRFENAERCLEKYSWDPLHFLGVNETSALNIYLRSKKKPATCNSTLIVWSEGGAYAFADISITVVPPILLPPFPKIPLIALILILIEFILLKFRKVRERAGKPSLALTLLAYLILFVILALMAYIFLWYFGYIPEIV